MNCDWQDIPDSTDAKGRRKVKCVRCGRVAGPTSDPPERIVARCKATPTPSPCSHLGAETRQQPCDSCNGGKTRIKIFACAIHGECTIGKRLDGLACCSGCGDYSPA
jgi:hypothetical protein